jgi:dihydroorotate dehydrogenase electron transfer subunit
MPQNNTRDTINLEQTEILFQKSYPENQFVLRLSAPLTAKEAAPGNFVHIQCGPKIPMRRPMSIMRVDPNKGWIDIMYKVHGTGTELLSTRSPGEKLSLLGPLGVPFKLSGYRRMPLLIGGGVGIPPMIFLSEHIRKNAKDCRPFVIAGSEIPFPFAPVPSKIMVSGMPEGTIASMPLMEDWGIPSRLTSKQGYSGCYDGFVTDLARIWLDSLDSELLQEVEIFSCGPTPMLKAVAGMADDYHLPCQVSLEEYMACGVGGCAGCAVLVTTGAGQAMKRVCVDGPVFEATTVFFR